MFIQFDVDYNKVTIDGILIPKPRYMSAKEWLEFWEQFDGDAIQDRITQSFDEGVRENEHEHEKELDHVKQLAINHFDKIYKKVSEVIYDNDFSQDEKFDKIVDAINYSTDDIRRYG